MALQHLYLLQQIQELVLEGPLTAKELAKAIGKPYPTLMRELNPYDQGAKLGLETFLEILEITGNLRPFGALARGLGYCLVRQNAEAEDREGYEPEREDRGEFINASMQVVN